MIRHQPLVERDPQLQALSHAVEGSSEAGRVVFVAGEAGHGKTSIVHTLVAGLDHRFRVMIATCEPVEVPAAFAPLYDLIDQLPDTLSHDIRSAPLRPSVNVAMLELVRGERMVLVFEDVHWADEATLGLLRYLGRRMETTPSTLVLTYRPEEVDLTHPLRLVIADLGPQAERVELPPLSPAGVGEMLMGLGVDPVAVHAATLGNPFFVEEIARHSEAELPPTIENAVLANVAKLPPEALDILYAIALSPEGVDVDVVLALDTDGGSHLDAALARRLLTSSGTKVACRHELIRESLAKTIPPVLKRSLHRRLLTELEARATVASDRARLAYHSIGAGDTDRAAGYSLQAAREAAHSGAHRQAAVHFANAIRHMETADAAPLSEALLEAAKEHSLVNDFSAAVELAARRVPLATDAVGQARAVAWLAFFLSRENDLPACRREASRAVEVLRIQPASEELAFALAVLAWVDLVEGNQEGAIRHGDAAVAAARAAGSEAAEVHAATTAGTARALLRDPEGLPQLRSAVELGVGGEGGEFAARSMNNLGLLSLWRGRLRDALDQFDRLIEYTAARELDAWYIAAIGTRAGLYVALGRWGEADADLEIVLGQRTCRSTEVETVTIAATLRARRDDPGASRLIEDALARLEGFDDHQATVAGCALAMEAAWIGLIPLSEAEGRYVQLLRVPALDRDTSGRGLLAFWARRLDLEPPSGRIPGPSGMEWAGHVDASARDWEERGYVVEAAITRAMSQNADLVRIFSDLAGLGAHGVIRGLRRELQRRGVERVPRGERITTRQHPAGLTSRQAEVLAMVALGMSNAEIADRLFISERTAGHHVSAILSKLGVSSRLQAVALASANEWISPERLAAK